ncbi:hypothetical protein [Rhodanobacter hydrolyticus]|uniref:Uncharacterized protein n=1 Tax=Rhodanobacter hydrolyticus TaxID=2250595 RepID=A0ABW8J6Z6_9GAMM
MTDGEKLLGFFAILLGCVLPISAGIVELYRSRKDFRWWAGPYILWSLIRHIVFKKPFDPEKIDRVITPD